MSYKMGEFELCVEEEYVIRHKNQDLIIGCDGIINFFLELGLFNIDLETAIPKEISHIDLSSEELEYLESMLRIAILDDKICSECCT